MRQVIFSYSFVPQVHLLILSPQVVLGVSYFASSKDKHMLKGAFPPKAMSRKEHLVQLFVTGFFCILGLLFTNQFLINYKLL